MSKDAELRPVIVSEQFAAHNPTFLYSQLVRNTLPSCF